MKQANECPCCGEVNFKKTSAILMPFLSKRIFGYDYVCIDESWNLYNFENTKAITLCHSLQCNNCEFLFCDLRFDDEEMSNLYNDYRGESYVQLRDFYEPGYRIKNEIINQGINYKSKIESFLSNFGDYRIILDWGGDDGINTPVFQANDLYIYDISNKKVLPNFTLLEKQDLKNYSYDLIVCSNVLEHVSYPRELLQDIRNYMSKDTVLYIEIPCEKLIMKKEIIDKNEIKRHWHEHINFYSENSIKELLKACNLNILEIEIFSNTLDKNLVNFDYIFMIACKKSF
jgi:SAM-dependent methyltransferase